MFSLDREVSRRWRERLADETGGAELRDTVARRWIPQPRSKDAKRWSKNQLELDNTRASLADADCAYYVRRDLDADRYARVAASLRQRIEDLTERRAALVEPQIASAQLFDQAWVKARWDAATNYERRQLVRLALVTKASRRGGHFDPTGRLSYEWRRPEAASSGTDT